jgi:hypothetical protein
MKNGSEFKTIKVPTEVFSRVSGYFRPVKQWNKGKQEEFLERTYLKINSNLEKDISISYLPDIV